MILPPSIICILPTTFPTSHLWFLSFPWLGHGSSRLGLIYITIIVCYSYLLVLSINCIRKGRNCRHFKLTKLGKIRDSCSSIDVLIVQHCDSRSVRTKSGCLYRPPLHRFIGILKMTGSFVRQCWLGMTKSIDPAVPTCSEVRPSYSRVVIGFICSSLEVTAIVFKVFPFVAWAHSLCRSISPSEFRQPTRRSISRAASTPASSPSSERSSAAAAAILSSSSSTSESSPTWLGACVVLIMPKDLQVHCNDFDDKYPLRSVDVSAMHVICGRRVFSSFFLPFFRPQICWSPQPEKIATIPY